ncbi:MAG: TerB N-terminal domain-containing protein, partial [Solobacterium sp.]|nr:TerB N-terminal domain-containing protein [Solobacterium sp.]
MKLAELTAYAEKKYHIREQFKWADYPGFSVLAEPQSGKWAALLMRRRDPESGRIIEACDMKYSGERPQNAAPWLCAPFRMHRENWIGIRMELCHDPDTVFRLLDSAMQTVSSQGFTIVLDSSRPADNAWQDTPLPAGRRPVQNLRKAVPARIREMRRLYRYGSGGFQERCRNFYVQAKFMEDYTDAAPWDGTLKQYFTTYQELTPEQLRGYFTWRTEVRRGNWQWISTSLAYL